MVPVQNSAEGREEEVIDLGIASKCSPEVE
jgi:hypothetical protein